MTWDDERLCFVTFEDHSRANLILRPSKRALHFRLSIQEQEVVLTYPYRLSPTLALEFIDKKKVWLKKHLDAQHLKSCLQPASLSFENLALNQSQLEVFYFKGALWPIKLLLGKSNCLEWCHKQEVILFTAIKKIISLQSAHTLQRLFHQACQNYLLNCLSTLRQRWQVSFSKKPQKLSVRLVKTYWGSCSSLDKLSFNLALVCAPEHVIEYVFVHEMCHLKEKNHSQNFWRDVSIRLPDYRQSQQWLKDHDWVIEYAYRLFHPHKMSSV